MTKEKAVEHQALDVSASQWVTAHDRGVGALVSDHLQRCSPALTGRTLEVQLEVEVQASPERPAEQLLELGLQRRPRDHHAQLFTVLRPGHVRRCAR